MQLKQNDAEVWQVLQFEVQLTHKEDYTKVFDGQAEMQVELYK